MLNVISYHHHGFSYYEAYRLPVPLRNSTYEWLIEQKNKEIPEKTS